MCGIMKIATASIHRKSLVLLMLHYNIADSDSSYNKNQDDLYNEMSSWVVVRTM